MDERVRIGKRIKELRKARGLSQERVAEMLDISTKYLSGVECGRVATDEGSAYLTDSAEGTILVAAPVAPH